MLVGLPVILLVEFVLIRQRLNSNHEPCRANNALANHPYPQAHRGNPAQTELH